jgi:hypothetical protein
VGDSAELLVRMQVARGVRPGWAGSRALPAAGRPRGHRLVGQAPHRSLVITASAPPRPSRSRESGRTAYAKFPNQADTCAMPRQGPITERQKPTTADGLVRVCVDCLRC